MPEETKECALCSTAKAELRVSVTSLDGTLLDMTECCRGCARIALLDLSLEVGR